MNRPPPLTRMLSALHTDFYELTMAYGYWKNKRHETPSIFSLYFRSNPFKGGYAIAAGLEDVIRFLKNFGFSHEEVEYLASLRTSLGNPWFERPFLDYLKKSRFQCSLEAIPEGTVVFPNEPLMNVQGPLWQCQLLESALLNLINFQTLIATKTSRIVWAAQEKPVIEFGLRRAQGPDGALSASRAAFIGGAMATSNVLAGKLFGIPVKGTHGHSWIMSYDSEKFAFEQYAECLPDDCILLVDTYDTITGVKLAIETAKQLKAINRKLFGIRIDSGDLAYLSQKARTLLDQAGLHDTQIIASNELDEFVIQSLNLQGARIDIWGVGTNLVTGSPQSAHNGIYKLCAIKKKKQWQHKIKVSDQSSKTTNPGIQKIRRFYNSEDFMEGDLIYDKSEDPTKAGAIHDPVNPHRKKRISKKWSHVELLVPIFEKGKKIYHPPVLSQIQSFTESGLRCLHAGHRRFENPHEYPVGLSPFLSNLKEKLIKQFLQRKEK